MEEQIFKVIFYSPPEVVDILLDSIDDVMTPIEPGYRRCFSVTDTVGTWVPMEGSNPHIGEIGAISRVNEKRVEFAVREPDLWKVLHIIDRVHPYEAPAVDVIPMQHWRSYLRTIK